MTTNEQSRFDKFVELTLLTEEIALQGTGIFAKLKFAMWDRIQIIHALQFVKAYAELDEDELDIHIKKALDVLEGSLDAEQLELRREAWGLKKRTP